MIDLPSKALDDTLPYIWYVYLVLFLEFVFGFSIYEQFSLLRSYTTLIVCVIAYLF